VKIAIPQVAVAYAKKKRTAMKAIESCAELRSFGLKVPYETKHDGVSIHNILEPEIIHQPWAALDSYCSNNTMRLGEPCLATRQRGMVQDSVRFLGPGNAATPRRIEEMNMSVNHRDRGAKCLKQGRRYRARCKCRCGFQEVSSSHYCSPKIRRLSRYSGYFAIGVAIVVVNRMVRTLIVIVCSAAADEGRARLADCLVGHGVGISFF
jgi:hypothetical protein